jgi:WD40 repeat protein
VGSKVTQGLAIQRGGASEPLVAAADVDGAIRLYDARQKVTVAPVVLRCHTGPCTAVAWSPNNQHQVRPHKRLPRNAAKT